MDLKTKYMGIDLKNPIIPSASPLSKELSGIKQMEDAGASAVVMESLFEEQISHEAREMDHFMSYHAESYAEALSYFPEPELYDFGPDEYLNHLRKVKESVDIPIIASINGVSKGGWTEYARKMQDAGADAIELNSYYLATNPDLSGREIEDNYIETLKAVKSTVSVPVAYKLSPFFTSIAEMAKRFDQAGADALVLFNRFYQPDIDLESLEVSPNLVLSDSDEIRLPLRWIAVLHSRIEASIAATSGIHTAEDIIKIMMAGADVAQICAVLLKKGISEISNILSGIEHWMDENEYESIEQMKGSMSYKNVAEPAAYSRANYMKVLKSYT